jgi:hypothetical protein
MSTCCPVSDPYLACTQELKQLLTIACHKDSRLLVIGVANAFTLVEEYAHELNLTVRPPLLPCRYMCKYAGCPALLLQLH